MQPNPRNFDRAFDLVCRAGHLIANRAQLALQHSRYQSQHLTGLGERPGHRLAPLQAGRWYWCDKRVQATFHHARCLP
jgi:hypothetical protein